MTELFYFSHLKKILGYRYSISPRLFENNSIEKIDKKIKELLDEDVFVICVFDADVSRRSDAENKKMVSLKKKYENNPNVILCERGIRTFEKACRFTFDINAIPLLKQMTHLPVIADPSHGTGISSIVSPVADADGIMIEVHNDPEAALCDGPQAVTLENFAQLVSGVKKYEKIRCIN